MRIDLLDMGRTKYGDCILVRHGGRSILIDGAHRGDTTSIRDQLELLLGHPPPFDVDLLVVTHCHSDHIGCLPALIASGDLTAKTALVADEKLGWGRDADDVGPVDAIDLSLAQRALVAALQEEGYADLPQAELEQFLQDAVILEEQFAEMLERLAQQGTKIIRFGRARATRVRQLEAAFADFGLKVLGPTKDHLVLCAAAIAQGTDAIAAAVTESDIASDADAFDLSRVYRALDSQMADAAFAADQPGVGAAKNDQSIILKVEADGWSALLAGDMQFAKAEVPDLTPFMTALRQTVVDAGPYDFIKLTHHTSYNALDASVLDEWMDTKLFAHTGGSNDANHPDGDVLELLESRQDQLTFARTDRNGIITITKNGKVQMLPNKGQLNDFTINQPPDEPEQEASLSEVRETSPVRSAATLTRAADGEMVEVITRVPHRATKVTLTIQVEPNESKQSIPDLRGKLAASATQTYKSPAGSAVSQDIPELLLGGGRPLPKLLFVTCRPRLVENIGLLEATRVFHALERARSVQVVDLPPIVKTAEEAAQIVRTKLVANQFAGVVLLGGYDVVPAHLLDVLDTASRQALEATGLDSEDADDFMIWSDELYGDLDGDFMPELPVSRIPDGRKGEVVFAALQAPKYASGPRFGVRNRNRLFATEVFPQLPGQGEQLEVSELFAPENVLVGAAAGAVYFMLHGSPRDATRFWGETQGGAAYEAVAIENVPDRAAGSVVFTGCCWGALAMSPPAARVRPDTLLRPRGPEASIAIAYLRAGALAFVGCTGSHYSPVQPPYNYFGKPMHDAFWVAIGQGKPPAEALYLAKTKFARGMPHGRIDPFSQAVEVKILRQFTCLGLGW
jgi:beta-lactamase superfamily II metal-dependent hydrolase